ncbi:MAG TPA: pyrroline-5-carboxylate reductase [Syntrophomonadaceae bacterium]|nr:pyrroline-5-carboxylate reductase [Syntrophomonadaceae bacterium]HPU47747.1 pyrroline-5-carboxylate reductase [Syntrophomonadaceae bacterium]
MILGVIGCGKMAQAILTGIHKQETCPYSVLLVNDIDGNRVRLFANLFQAAGCDQRDLVRQSDLVILAVKPSQVGDVLAYTAAAWNPGKILVSVAAGVKTSAIQSYLPGGIKIVRTMPNLPALVGEGIVAVYAAEGTEEEDLRQVESLLSGIGKTVRVEEEKMDAVTAVSGSGPAYVMMVVEAMMEAGVHIGLDWSLARQLVLTTISGSIAMLEKTGQHPAEIRNQVSSPGGTTIAAIKQLEEQGLRSAFFNAIEKAYQRSKQLGRE